jgi:hypothetical protein
MAENTQQLRPQSRGAKWYKENIERAKESGSRWWKQNPRLRLLYAARRRAKAEGLTFDLVVNDIVIPEVCPVLGIKLFQGTKEKKDNAPTIDRFLPVLGYTKRNIRVISWRANVLKKNATVEEMKKVLRYMEGIE